MEELVSFKCPECEKVFETEVELDLFETSIIVFESCPYCGANPKRKVEYDIVSKAKIKEVL